MLPPVMFTAKPLQVHLWPPCTFKPLYSYNFQFPQQCGVGPPQPARVYPPLYHWSPECVGQWLVNIGLKKYQNLFCYRRIDGQRLMHMLPDDFVMIGVHTLQDAIRINDNVEQLSRCLQQRQDSIPKGLPYHCQNAIYFGQVPLHSQLHQWKMQHRC